MGKRARTPSCSAVLQGGAPAEPRETFGFDLAEQGGKRRMALVAGAKQAEARRRMQARRDQDDRAGDRKQPSAARGLERVEDAAQRTGDGRTAEDGEPELPLLAGEEIDVAGLVRQGDVAALGVIGIRPLGFAEDEMR